MRICPRCGRRLVLGGKRSLKRIYRVDKLVEQLHEARKQAEGGSQGAPPEIRSALLEVTPLLAPLLADGMTLAVDLHERAHDATYPLELRNVDAWEKRAERVLVELLYAFDSL